MTGAVGGSRRPPISPRHVLFSGPDGEMSMPMSCLERRGSRRQAPENAECADLVVCADLMTGSPAWQGICRQQCRHNPRSSSSGDIGRD